MSTHEMNKMNFSRARIIVVGDVMLDQYWHGTADRISREAPIPVVVIRGEDHKLGGASNVASNLAALGVDVSLYGIIGTDQTATDLKILLGDCRIKHYLLQASEVSTIRKLRVVDSYKQMIRLDFESPFPTHYGQQLQKQLLTHRSANVLLLSDYGNNTITDAAALIQYGKEQGMTVIVDPRGDDYTPYSHCDLLTPNRSEFEHIVGTCADQNEIVDKGTQLLKDLDLGHLLITLSSHGMILLSQAGKPFYLPANTRDVFDVTGAGDTVIAVIAASLSIGVSLRQAVTMANMAAGVSVTKWGTTQITPDELTDLMKKDSLTP